MLAGEEASTRHICFSKVCEGNALSVAAAQLLALHLGDLMLRKNISTMIMNRLEMNWRKRRRVVREIA